MLGRLAACTLLALAACAGGEANWAKPGADADRTYADYEECRAGSRAATQRDAAIDADILATRSLDWQNTGTLTLHRDEMAYSTGKRAQNIIAACMTAKGYRLAR
jgi:hypothetical protein